MRAIRGTTRLAGVIGDPLAHSLSPVMHNAAYEHLELDWVYLPLHVQDEVGLRRTVAAVRSLDFVGFNVTMPFKQSVLELCDEVAMAAKMAGAVNTVHCHEGRLLGYNTDGRGLLEALELEAGFIPADKDVVILGAGGAAGAALVALILARAASVTIVNRDLGRAEALLDRLAPHLGEVRSTAVTYEDAEEPVRSADLVINATSVGMGSGDESPIPAEWIGPQQVLYDMVYGTTAPTAMVKHARARGAVGLDGLGMLVGQGAMAIDIWSGSVQPLAPRDVMRRAAEQEIAARSEQV